MVHYIYSIYLPVMIKQHVVKTRYRAHNFSRMHPKTHRIYNINLLNKRPHASRGARTIYICTYASCLVFVCVSDIVCLSRVLAMSFSCIVLL